MNLSVALLKPNFIYKMVEGKIWPKSKFADTT